MLPEAGPGSNSFGGMGGNGNDGGGMNGTQIINKAALSYLESHNTGETYLFATSDYSIAAPYIIEAGAKVIITGGFTGSDPALTVAELAGLVGEGELKYFITSASGGGRGGNSELSAWITKHGTVIPTEEWSAGSNTDQVSFQGGSGGSMILYQLKAEAIIGAS